MKLNGTRLKKRSPRKITKFKTRNGGQNTNLQLTRVNQIACVNKKIQLEKSKPAKFSQQKHRNTRLFRRITRPFFIPLLVFPFTLQRQVREKFHFQKKKSNVSLCGRSEMISLQVFPRIGAVRTRGPDGKIQTAGARVISQSDSRI